MIKIFASFFLLLFVLGYAQADCQGCCSRHGGVVCVNGVTRCGDGTPLSSTCQAKGCNKCLGNDDDDDDSNSRSFTAPTFIHADNVYWNDSNDLVCLLPDPNSDGLDILSSGTWGYQVSIFVDCEAILGLDAMDIQVSEWPMVLELQGEVLPDEFEVHIRRVDDHGHFSPSVTFQAPTERDLVITDLFSYTRWLPHIPAEGGGYTSRLKITNRNPISTQIRLTGFDKDGQYVTNRAVTIGANSSKQIVLAGDTGFFGSLSSRISHIGLEDSNGFTEVYQQFRSDSSGFSSWIKEIDFADGLSTGQAFTVEQRTTESSADGLAILNLTSSNDVPVKISLRNQTGEIFSPISVGVLGPGEKILVVPSELFAISENAHYFIETGDPNHHIQVMGFSFAGTEFFSPLSVNKIR